MNKRLWVIVGLMSVVLLSSCGSDENKKAESQALQAAEEWLTLVDSGSYAESWETASDLFRNAVQGAVGADLRRGAHPPGTGWPENGQEGPV